MSSCCSPEHPAVAPLSMASRTPRSPRFCRIVLRELTTWFNWLTDHHIGSLGDVTQGHCERYLAEHSHTTASRPRRLLDPGTRKRLVATMQSIAAYLGLYSTDRYQPGFIPWPGQTAFEVVGGKNTVMENKTSPLPDTHLRPLLAAALHLVQQIGPRLATLVEQHGTTGTTTTRWGHEATTIAHPTGEPVPWSLPLTWRQVRSMVVLTHFSTLIVTAALTGMRSSKLSEIHLGARRDAVPTPGTLAQENRPTSAS
jgi:hypothetical protein